MSVSKSAIVLQVLGWAAALIVASAMTAADAQQTASVSTTTQRPLDLRTPDINRVFTPSELRTMTRARDEYADDVEQVSVETSRDQPIIAPSGLRGIGWAIRHPTQAWRLFVPSPSN